MPLARRRSARQATGAVLHPARLEPESSITLSVASFRDAYECSPPEAAKQAWLIEAGQWMQAACRSETNYTSNTSLLPALSTFETGHTDGLARAMVRLNAMIGFDGPTIRSITEVLPRTSTNQSVVYREAGEASRSPNTQLSHQRFAVRLHRSNADGETGAYLLVGTSPRDLYEDLALAAG